MHQATPPAPAPQRFDAGKVRVSGRDITGLMLCGEMYGAPYDLLAGYLDVQPDRLRGIAARWRAAGYAQTGRPGPGPAWCWLTKAGLAVTGLQFAPGQPALGRLAHTRAVLAARLALQASPAGQAGQPWRRSERRIRAAIGGRVGGGHIPDAEADWTAGTLPANEDGISVWSCPIERQAVFGLSVALRSGDADTALRAAATADAGWATGGPRNPANWAQVRVGPH